MPLKSKGKPMKTPTAVLIAAAALATPLALGAQTVDLPPRKAGLWDVTTVVEKPAGAPMVTAQMCLDPATDRELMDYALKLSGNCKSFATKREGKSLVIDADCTIGGKATKSKVVLSGDFQSTYTARIEGTMDGGSKGPQSMLTTEPTRESMSTPRSSTLRRVPLRSTAGSMPTGRFSCAIKVTEAFRWAFCPK